MIISIKIGAGYWLHQVRIKDNLISHKYRGYTKVESLKLFKEYIKQLK
jgi:hypothetical protein